MKITRHPENPIVVPGIYNWRKVTVFNPAVIMDNGKFYMIERTAESLTPCKNVLGLLESEDGVHFTHVKDEPIITPDMLGFPYGSVQDPRIVKIEGTYYLNYALRPCAMSYYPTGSGVPERSIPSYPDGWGEEEGHWLTRSSILKSDNLLDWEFVSDTTPLDINDRDNILFPEKINGKYYLLRRPEEYVGEAYGTEKAAMWITSSEDLIHWDEPVLLAKAENPEWESKKSAVPPSGAYGSRLAGPLPWGGRGYGVPRWSDAAGFGTTGESHRPDEKLYYGAGNLLREIWLPNPERHFPDRQRGKRRTSLYLLRRDGYGDCAGYRSAG